MLVNMDYSNLYCKRFDFGVPLEDIFISNDIHPKLKYLFEKAYETVLDTRHNIPYILRHLQGSLDERITFKESLVHNPHYRNCNASSGIVLWTIRHFLGMLPLPLLPTYTNGEQFNWLELSQQCKWFLQLNKCEKIRSTTLDYKIAECISRLPMENIVMLHVLLHFFRELGCRLGTSWPLKKRALFSLAQFFYSAVFIRPYTPGFVKMNEKIYFVLMYYLIINWPRIKKKCYVTLADPLFTRGSSLKTCIVDKSTQTKLMIPEVITIHQKIPYFPNDNSYLQDASCQTEISGFDGVYKNVPHITKVTREGKPNHEKCCSNDQNNSTEIDDDPLLTESSFEVYFFEKKDSKVQEDWAEICQETAATVKRVEEYMYDDYETFRCEKFNQISANKSISYPSSLLENVKIFETVIDEEVKSDVVSLQENKCSLVNKISKMGWTYTPLKNTSGEVLTSERNSGITSFKNYHQTCFDENDPNRSNILEEDPKRDVKPSKECVDELHDQNNLKDLLCDEITESETLSASSEFKVNKKSSSRFYNIRRKFKFLNFFKSRKLNNSSSFDNIKSSVRYKKMQKNKSKSI